MTTPSVPPPYTPACPLGQDPTDLSRLNPLIRTSSTTKVSLSRTESIAATLRSAVGRKKGTDGGGEREESVSLQLILAGKTLSPIGVEDLRGWLRWKEMGQGKRQAVKDGAGYDEETGRKAERWNGAEGVLDFLVAFEQYRTDFFALDADEQALSPTPFQLISLLALAQHHQSNSYSSASRLPNLPLAKPQASYRPRSPSESSATSDRPSVQSTSRLPSSTSKPQRPLYPLPPTTSRARSESAPPPLAFVVEGESIPLRTLPNAILLDGASSSGASVRSGASSRRTAGGLRGMGRAPLAGAQELSEEEEYGDDRPASRTGSQPSRAKSSQSGRLRSTSGGTLHAKSNAATLRTSPSLNSVRTTASRPRAATLPASPTRSFHLAPFDDPLADFNHSRAGRAQDEPPPVPAVESLLSVSPANQPLREQLATLLALADGLPTEFDPTEQVRSEAAMTTHPDVLSRLAASVEEWAEREWLMGKGGFLQDALENLDHRTALGRLLCGSFLSFVAIVTFFLLLLDPSPFRSDGTALSRPWRLIVVPMFLGGIGYAMGSRKSLCFWLALFGVREPSAYESPPIPLEPIAHATAHSRSNSTATSTLRHKHRQPSLSSVLEEDPELSPRSSMSFSLAPTISITHSRSPSQASLLPRTHHTRTSPFHRLFHRIRLRLPSPLKLRLDIKWSPTFILLWRLTGTAWGTQRVADPRVLRAQRKGAWKIAGVLCAGVGVLGGVVVGVPGIRVGG